MSAIPLAPASTKDSGVSPSITCADPSLDNYTCSCACTNGLIFKQPPPRPGHGSSESCYLSFATCQADQSQYLEREQNLMKQLIEKQEELTRRIDEWKAEKKKGTVSDHSYIGCYINAGTPVLAGVTLAKSMTNSVDLCERRRRGSDFFFSPWKMDRRACARADLATASSVLIPLSFQYRVLEIHRRSVEGCGEQRFIQNRVEEKKRLWLRR